MWAIILMKPLQPLDESNETSRSSLQVDYNNVQNISKYRGRLVISTELVCSCVWVDRKVGSRKLNIGLIFKVQN